MWLLIIFTALGALHTPLVYPSRGDCIEMAERLELMDTRALVEKPQRYIVCLEVR